MAYLNVDIDYFSHPKVARLVGLIGAQHVAVPIRLWCYVGKHHCEDGMLKGYSKQEIESILCWKGKRGELVDALVRVGFLDAVSTGEDLTYQVHDWLEHAGHLAAFKRRGKLNAEKRWNKLAGIDATGIPGNHATGIATPMLLPTNHPTYQPTNHPNEEHGVPPPQRKCEGNMKDGPCQDYAMPGSKFCESHRQFYKDVREKRLAQA